MLYLFAGDDGQKKYLNFEKFLASLKDGSQFFNYTQNNFNEIELENFYSGNNLFYKNSVVILENLLDREERAEFLLTQLEEMAASPNHFVFLESKLAKGALDIFKTKRAELNIFELPKEKKEKFNNFLLADAFGAKNKVNLWVNFRRAVDLGVGLEELVGVLFWKAKEMTLRNDFSKFSKEELNTFTSRIAYLLPKARKEGLDAEIAMEQFLLESL